VIDPFGLPGIEQTNLCDRQRTILNFPTNQLFVTVSAPYRVFKNTSLHEATLLCSKYFICLFEQLGPNRLMRGTAQPALPMDITNYYPSPPPASLEALVRR